MLNFRIKDDTKEKRQEKKGSAFRIRLAWTSASRRDEGVETIQMSKSIQLLGPAWKICVRIDSEKKPACWKQSSYILTITYFTDIISGN